MTKRLPRQTELAQALRQLVQELTVGARAAHPLQERLRGGGDVLSCAAGFGCHHLRDHPPQQPYLAQRLLVQQQFLAAGSRTYNVEGREDTALL